MSFAKVTVSAPSSTRTTQRFFRAETIAAPRPALESPVESVAPDNVSLIGEDRLGHHLGDYSFHRPQDAGTPIQAKPDSTALPIQRNPDDDKKKPFSSLQFFKEAFLRANHSGQFQVPNRGVLAHAVQGRHLYSRSVSGVNEALDNQEVDLSDNMRDRISQSVREVEESKIHQPTAHGREFSGFGKEALTSPKNRGINSLGAFMNLLGFFVSGGIEHAKYRTGRK